MKKEGIVFTLLVILLISISFVIPESNETEVNNETADINETETNETINETEIEYTDEELAEIMPDAGITPDSVFYGVDVFVDNAKAILTPTSLGKAKIRLDIVGERMAEMEEMVYKNKKEDTKRAELEAQKQMQKFEGSVKKIKKIKEKDASELKEQLQRNTATLEILKQILLDYDSDWADAMADALEIMKTSESYIANIPEDFDFKPQSIFDPGTSTFESMIAQCIESGESPEECEKIEDFCKGLMATTAEECVEMLSSGFLTPTFRKVSREEMLADPHGCISGSHSSYITQKKYCCEDTDEDYFTEHKEKTDDRLLHYYYVKGIVDYKVIILKTDEVDHEIYTDSCDGDKLTEWECAEQDRMLSEEYDCPYGCEDGACLPSCNFDFICDNSEDCSCSDCEGKRNGCKNPSLVCHDGSCMPEEVLQEVVEEKCKDSDEGMNYFIKGIINIGEHNVGEDYCENDLSLIEYFCGNNVISSIPYSCQNGCEDGACI